MQYIITFIIKYDCFFSTLHMHGYQQTIHSFKSNLPTSNIMKVMISEQEVQYMIYRQQTLPFFLLYNIYFTLLAIVTLPTFYGASKTRASTFINSNTTQDNAQ